MYDPRKHHRRSIRLKGYDYAQPGAYFVTICVRDRKRVLGRVEAEKVVFSGRGPSYLRLLLSHLGRDIMMPLYQTRVHELGRALCALY
jgi:hypothetical protein